MFVSSNQEFFGFFLDILATSLEYIRDDFKG